MKRNTKRRAPRSDYPSPSQPSFPGIETPFYNQLDPANRWVVLSAQIPWDDLNPDHFSDVEALNTIVRFTAGNFRLIDRLFSQIIRISNQ